MQGIHKRMAWFWKLLKMYFSSYTGTTYTVSSRICPSFSCATSSSLLILTAGQWDQFPKWRHSRRRLSVLRFQVSRFVITVHEFRAWFKKYVILVCCIIFKLCMKLMLHCNHISGHGAHRRPSAVMPAWKLVLWPRCKHENWTAVMLVFMDRRFWCLLLFTYFLRTLNNLKKKILAWLTYTNFISSTAGTKHTFAAGGNARKSFLKINNTFQLMNCAGTQQVEICKF
jgi:hypothetical protein